MTASDAATVAAAHRTGTLTGAGGLRLHWQAWVPEEPRAAVVIVHGASEHGGRYRYVVERLAPEGFALYAMDHRGHGRSEGARSLVDRMDNVVSDLDAFVDLVAAETPGLPLFMLGHSMGGCVSIAYALRHQEKLSALALSAPLAALEAAPLPLRLIAKGLSLVVPKTGVYSVPAGGISRDPAEVEAYDSDPLVYRGKLPARTVQELSDTIAHFEEQAPTLTLPLLLMHGTADEIVPDTGTRMVHERAGSTDKTLHRYEGYYHEIFNEPPGERDRVLDDLTAWLNERV